MTEPRIIDHLFRHQYGKMVSILSRIFGLQQLHLIEDAVQDTFISAMKTWRNGIPENPEAWLTAAAKNRAVDLLRQVGAEQQRALRWNNGTATIALNELFLDTEIADSQLRMIFTACNPALKPQDQIAFALKTISGFSAQEIASALLLKEETVKKRLVRARKTITEENIAFEIPAGHDLPARLHRVMEVIYLIFNEGFHSGQKQALIREELCGEAIRLCKLLLCNEHTATGDTLALFALFCFHSARLRSKVNAAGEVLSLKEQNRSLWYRPLIEMGYTALNKAVMSEFGIYHYEAAIAAEHVMAHSYEETNWKQILEWYRQLDALQPSPFHRLNMATVQLQLENYTEARALLDCIDPQELEQRVYLYHGLWAEYYKKQGMRTEGLKAIDQALASVSNEAERHYLEKKKAGIIGMAC